MADAGFIGDAEMINGARERVREMRRRALLAAQDMEGGAIPMPAFANLNRNWNPNPNGRQVQTPPQNREEPRAPAPQPQPEAAPMPEPPVIPVMDSAPPLPPDENTANPQPQAEQPGPREPQTGTTLVEDVVGRLGLDSDTLLIIGLILILVNQKADNTLILALAYLLF
ncbi:MAG: hypothetical protein FWH02_00440 [Oscillospiraceae bacterium]|nr:hypothetical protein [Oscillospiraceae bacterium]